MGSSCEAGPNSFEAEGVALNIAKEAMQLAADKLPVHTKFIVARDYKA